MTKTPVDPTKYARQQIMETVFENRFKTVLLPDVSLDFESSAMLHKVNFEGYY